VYFLGNGVVNIKFLFLYISYNLKLKWINYWLRICPRTSLTRTRGSTVNRTCSATTLSTRYSSPTSFRRTRSTRLRRCFRISSSTRKASIIIRRGRKCTPCYSIRRICRGRGMWAVPRKWMRGSMRWSANSWRRYFPRFICVNASWRVRLGRSSFRIYRTGISSSRRA